MHKTHYRPQKKLKKAWIRMFRALFRKRNINPFLFKLKLKKFFFNKKKKIKKFLIVKPLFSKTEEKKIQYLRVNKFYFKSINTRVRQISLNIVFFSILITTIILSFSYQLLYEADITFFNYNIIWILLYLVLPYFAYKNNIYTFRHFINEIVLFTKWLKQIIRKYRGV